MGEREKLKPVFALMLTLHLAFIACFSKWSSERSLLALVATEEIAAGELASAKGFKYMCRAVNNLRRCVVALCCLLLVSVCYARAPVAAARAVPIGLTPEEKAWLEEHPVIRVAADPDYAPFQFTNKDGRSVGLANDYLAIISSRLGLRFEYQHTDSWSESLQLIRDRKADMVAVATQTPERLQYMRFTTPYVEFPDVLITRSGERVASLAQLHGNQLLTIQGFGINEYLRAQHPQISLQMAPDVKTLLEKISTGEADVGVLNLATVSYEIDKSKISNLSISGATDFSYGLALASRDDWPILHSVLQKGIDSLRDEERQSIARRWVGLSSEPWRPSQQQYVIFAVVVILFGFAATLAWNRQLRKTVEVTTRDLRTSELEYSNLYKTALVGLFRTTIDGRKVLEANAALAYQFGYDSVESFIKHFASRDTYVEPGRRQELLRSLRRHERVDNFEFLGRLRDGSVRSFLLSATLYENKGYLEGAVLDITDRKKAENEAKAAREIAEQTNRTKSAFLAAASHDLRQPLHAMSLLTGQLCEQLQQNDQAMKILAQINNSQSALSDILNALLDISRLDAGVLKPRLSHFPIAQLFGQLEQEFAPLALERGLSLRFRAAQAWLHTDASLLFRVLANLVDNAIKNSAAPGVLVAARRRGERWCIEVRDCGGGIPVEQQGAIFDEFIQLDNPGRDRSKGLGLGLSIVRRLNQLLKLEMSLDSKLGRGSCFKLLVPSGEPIQNPLELAPPVDEAGYSLQGATVLVVDDDREVLDATRALLASWKCAVLTASGMDEAIREAEDEEIDLIIADYNLAGIHNGLEVIEAITRNNKSKALIISGDVNLAGLPQLCESGYPVLSKPVAPLTLRSTLHRLMLS